MIKIAFRNLLRNKRRSFFTVLAISLGFAAVSLFGGFAEYMYRGSRAMAIYGRCIGHLMIFKEGFLEKGLLDPERYLINPKELKTIRDICRKIPQVDLVAPHLMISGLVTNGKVSTIFIAQGIASSSVDIFMSRAFQQIKEYDGKKLEDSKIYGVAVARGLAKLLDLKVGSDAVAFTNTVDGQMNALDMEVFQLFDTESDTLNDKVMRVPLKFAQALYDTESVDRVAILLSRHENTIPIRDELQRLLSAHLPNFEVKTWKEMSQWYRKIKEMFDVIFVFLFIIVFVIVITSVVNTMSMAVIERTREIGTLRSLGLKRRGVITLFAIESFLLALLGTLGGIILTLSGSWTVDIIQPTWVPPAITQRVPIMIILSWDQMFFSFIFLIILCLVASLLPARRAAHQNVVNALGHV